MAKRTKTDPLDAKINEIFRRRCNGIQIPIFDIPKIFAAGKKAFEADLDVEQAVVDFVESIRTNAA